jgi:hypothetical protein
MASVCHVYVVRSCCYAGLVDYTNYRVFYLSQYNTSISVRLSRRKRSVTWKREVFIYRVLEKRSVLTEAESRLLSWKREVFTRKREMFYGREKYFQRRWKVSAEKRACPCEASVLSRSHFAHSDNHFDITLK